MRQADDIHRLRHFRSIFRDNYLDYRVHTSLVHLTATDQQSEEEHKLLACNAV
jgi:hypothetical protein